MGVVAFLNTLHYGDTPGLTLAILDLFKRRISSVDMAAAMYAYGSTSGDEHLVALEARVDELEKALQTSPG
jgi:hypothetical protein